MRKLIGKYELKICVFGREESIEVGKMDQLTKDDRDFIVNNKKAFIQEIKNIKKEKDAKLTAEIKGEIKEKYKSFIEKAIATGIEQFIDKWDEPCNDKNESCEIDIVKLYAMPDGELKSVRNHTW